MKQTNILEYDCYRVDFLESAKPQGHLAFTFTEAGNTRLDGLGFGGKFLLDNGFDVVSIRTDQDRWYSDFAPAHVETIQEYLGRLHRTYSRRAGYGSSMGAFAAIKFSRSFRLDSVLAISPQFDITREWDMRWRRQAAALECMPVVTPEDLNHACSYFIAFDPQDPDRAHYDLFASLIPHDLLFPIIVRNSGHPSGYVLSEAKVLQDVSLSVLAKGELTPEWRAKLKENRRQSPLYLFNLAVRSSARGHYAWAARLLRLALVHRPLNAEYHVRLAMACERLGKFGEMLNHAALAVACNPQHPDMASTLARALSYNGLPKQANVYIDRALELSNHNPKYERLRAEIVPS